MLRLNPPRAGHQHFPHRKGPIKPRDDRTRPITGVRRLARPRAIHADKGRHDRGVGGGVGRLLNIGKNRWRSHQSPCPSSKTLFKFTRNTREAVKKAKDVDERETDELALFLLGGAKDVLLAQFFSYRMLFSVRGPFRVAAVATGWFVQKASI